MDWSQHRRSPSCPFLFPTQSNSLLHPPALSLWSYTFLLTMHEYNFFLRDKYNLIAPHLQLTCSTFHTLKVIPCWRQTLMMNYPSVFGVTEQPLDNRGKGCLKIKISALAVNLCSAGWQDPWTTWCYWNLTTYYRHHWGTATHSEDKQVRFSIHRQHCAPVTLS